MSRGRSASPRPLREPDVDMNAPTSPTNTAKKEAKVVIITNLTRNVVEPHLRTIFGFYGQITKIDLPLYANSGQNRGKAALEYLDTASASKAASHMDGGQLDGAILKVELSDLPIRTRSRSPRARPPRNGRKPSFSRSRSFSRSPSRSRSRTRSPAPNRRRPDFRDSRRGRGFNRRGPPGRASTFRPRSRSRSRSLSPVRRPSDRLPPRRRSPSYSRGGYTRPRRSRTRSRSYSVRSSRSRTRSLSKSRSLSRSRSRSLSYSSYSRYSRSKSRSRSASRGKRSHSRDDIRDSRSRSPRN